MEVFLTKNSLAEEACCECTFTQRQHCGCVSKPGPDIRNIEHVWIFFPQASVGMIEKWTQTDMFLSICVLKFLSTHFKLKHLSWVRTTGTVCHCNGDHMSAAAVLTVPWPSTSHTQTCPHSIFSCNQSLNWISKTQLENLKDKDYFGSSGCNLSWILWSSF